jgi:hypothetical protein
VEALGSAIGQEFLDRVATVDRCPIQMSTSRPDTSRSRCSRTVMTPSELIGCSWLWKYNLPSGQTRRRPIDGPGCHSPARRASGPWAQRCARHGARERNQTHLRRGLPAAAPRPLFDRRPCLVAPLRHSHFVALLRSAYRLLGTPGAKLPRQRFSQSS